MEITKKGIYKNTIPLLYLIRNNIHLSSLKTPKNYLIQLKNTHFLYTLARTCIQCSSLKSQTDSIKNGN